jgi:hypothetical protein
MAEVGVIKEPSNSSVDDENYNATTALVAFLRMEAEMAEQKAKRFREQASALARQFGISEASQSVYGTFNVVIYKTRKRSMRETFTRLLIPLMFSLTKYCRIESRTDGPIG